MELNHTIVPAHDRDASARFYERVLGLELQPEFGHFRPIHIAGQSLTLDLLEQQSFDPHHYAFKVTDAEFDEIFGRVKAEGLTYGSGPFSSTDGQINTRDGGRGVYFRDPSGHLLELITRDYGAETAANA